MEDSTYKHAFPAVYPSMIHLARIRIVALVSGTAFEVLAVPSPLFLFSLVNATRTAERWAWISKEQLTQ